MFFSPETLGESTSSSRALYNEQCTNYVHIEDGPKERGGTQRGRIDQMNLMKEYK